MEREKERAPGPNNDYYDDEDEDEEDGEPRIDEGISDDVRIIVAPFDIFPLEAHPP